MYIWCFYLHILYQIQPDGNPLRNTMPWARSSGCDRVNVTGWLLFMSTGKLNVNAVLCTDQKGLS